MSPAILFAAAWMLWAVSWLAAASWSAPTERRVAATSPAVWSYRALLGIAAVLIYHRTNEALHAGKLWHVDSTGAYVLVALAVVGFGFAWWARLHLGRLWSGAVTRKEGHRVVDTGPYALVRHPIYTGLLLAVIATAAAVATPPALLGIVFAIAGLWRKARLEERFLGDELGAEAYASYRARVPMLLPFWPAAGGDR